jgi:hypothetical protein
VCRAQPCEWAAVDGFSAAIAESVTWLVSNYDAARKEPKDPKFLFQ